MEEVSREREFQFFIEKLFEILQTRDQHVIMVVIHDGLNRPEYFCNAANIPVQMGLLDAMKIELTAQYAAIMNTPMVRMSQEQHKAAIAAEDEKDKGKPN
jgi:hypothetical protein